MSSFICKVCGDCCKGEGSVFLYPDDIRKIAQNMSMTVQEVIDKYTEYVMMETIDKGGSYSYMPFLVLKKNKGGCIFLNSTLCEIHKFKPFQCEHTPFVSEFFSDEEWRKQLKTICPAIGKMKEPDYNAYTVTGQRSDKAEQDYYVLLRENSFNLEKILDVKLAVPKMLTYHE